MIADALRARDITVVHILDAEQRIVHPWIQSRPADLHRSGGCRTLPLKRQINTWPLDCQRQLAAIPRVKEKHGPWKRDKVWHYHASWTSLVCE